MLKNNHKGAALPLTLMVFVVMFVLGIGILQISMADTKETSWQANKVQAHYLARSGVQVGIKMLQDRLATWPNTGNLLDLVNNLNSSIYLPDFNLDGVGTYTISFSLTPLDEIKITSVGTTTAQPSAKSTVTYTKKIKKGASFSSAAERWFHTNGFNLAKGINPDDNPQPNPNSFIGKIAYLKNDTRTMANPSVGGDISVFRASIINIGEKDGVSIDQSSNSYAEFDAELIFFDGSLLQKNDSYIELLVSNKVLAQKTLDSYDNNYPNPAEAGVGGAWSLDFLEFNSIVGFENNERYRAFLKAFGTSDSIIETAITNYRPDPSAFISDEKYGIVKLKNIKDNHEEVIFQPSGINANKGYFYFPNEVYLHIGVTSGSDYGRDKLIPIDDSDPIIDILDSLLKWNYGSESGTWNYQ